MGPEFNKLWDTYFKDKPDKPVMFGSIVSGAYADHSLLPPGKYMTMCADSAYLFLHCTNTGGLGSTTLNILRAEERSISRPQIPTASPSSIVVS